MMENKMAREPLGYLNVPTSPRYDYVVVPVPTSPYVDLCQPSMNDGGRGGGGGGQTGAVAKAGDSSWMRELRDWMKSLRLHKYTDRLLGLTYEELVTLTDKDLQNLFFTEGAKGKFLKHLAHMRDRSRCIKELLQSLEEITELRDLLGILSDMEKIIIMPMKPIQSQQQQLPQFSGVTPTQKLNTPATCSTVAIISREERRHESGSDSGTEQDTTTATATATSSAEPGGSIAHLIFELLEKTFSIIICRQQDDRDRDRVVMHFFRLVERRCLRRDAFTTQHKAWFQTWLKRMDQVWDITNAMAAAELEAKRKYSHDFSMRRASLQSPSPRSNVFCPNFPRGVSPVGLASYGTSSMSGFNTAQAATAAALLAAASGGPGGVTSASGLLQPPSSDQRISGQRRSVPDLNPPPVFPVHMKRNSYQGEHRMPPLVDSRDPRSLVDSDMLNSLLDPNPSSGVCSGNGPFNCNHASCAFSRRACALSISSWDSGFSGRNSSLSACTDDSRRNSSLSAGTDESRRNSSMSCSTDESRRNSSLSAGIDESRRNSSLSVGIDESRRNSSLSVGIDESRRNSSLSGGIDESSRNPALSAGVDESRHNSSLSAGIDESRRNSSLSSFVMDSRRNSSLSDDCGRKTSAAEELFPSYPFFDTYP